MTESKKPKRLSKEKIKTKLLHSITIVEVLEYEVLNKKAEEVQDPEKAVEIIKRYEDMKNKGIINVACYQRQVFKRFKEKGKFAKLVSEFRNS